MKPSPDARALLAENDFWPRFWRRWWKPIALALIFAWWLGYSWLDHRLVRIAAEQAHRTPVACRIEFPLHLTRGTP